MQYELCKDFLCVVPEEKVKESYEKRDRHLHYVTEAGRELKLSMRRAPLYFEQGRGCVRCHRRGTVWTVTEIIHKKESELHLDLYDVTDGVMVMMTRDHIVPRRHRQPAKHASHVQTVQQKQGQAHEPRGCRYCTPQRLADTQKALRNSTK